MSFVGNTTLWLWSWFGSFAEAQLAIFVKASVGCLFSVDLFAFSCLLPAVLIAVALYYIDARPYQFPTYILSFSNVFLLKFLVQFCCFKVWLDQYLCLVCSVFH